jgi:diguanylate cyclase (GGDEF)-like protein
VPADAPAWPEHIRACLPRVTKSSARRSEWHPGDALLVPLFDQDHRLSGLLRLGAPADGARPSSDTIASLTAFATHAAVAIENAREHRELQEVTAELEEQLAVRHEILDASRALLSTLDEVTVFAKISQMLGGLVRYQALAIGLVDRDAQLLRPAFYAEDGAVLQREATLSLDEPEVAEVVRSGQAALFNEGAGQSVPWVPGAERAPRSVILTPLAVGGEAFGLLGVARFTEGARQFGSRELELVQLLANLAAIALQNARSYKEMLHLASSDGLTGVHNHRHFRETLEMEASRAQRYGETFCLLMMDLDHFKAVNDTVGHQQGDEVLKAVATILRQCSRESDYLARYGGEEFVMILPRTSLAEASTVAERIRERVRKIDAGSPELRVSISIGAAAYRPGADADSVLRAADTALLRAKATGRNRVCLQLEPPEPEPEDEMVTLGRELAAHIGLTAEESEGLSAAVALLSLAVPASAPGALAVARVAGVWSRAEALDALLYSTERWDGTGYPEGRRGSEIPRVARAFAVVRTFVAAGGQHDPVEAAHALWARSGTELDPHMVRRVAGAIVAGEPRQAVCLGGSQASE